MEAVFSVLIPAIVESVFGALTEAVGLSDWLRQRLGRDPEKLAFHQALIQALTDSATHYPGRDLCYFAEILRDIGGPLLARTLQPAATWPTVDELTSVWLNHLTVDSLIHYRAEFTQFAGYFLNRLQFHLENQQPLRWITQSRHERSSDAAIRRTADAAEQSATSIEALRQDVARLTATLVTVLQTGSSSTVTTGGGTYNAGTISAQNFAGRDLTIKNYFVTGLPRLVIDYSSRIQDFLLEYLGSKRKKVPFGGRQQQLAELNAWLDDSASPPYYLMTAEAGRGKSALVCRWLAQLTTRSDLDVIFVPISIRVETATQDVAFAALAARLANLYESEPEKLPPASLTAEQWKGVCQSYLRREPPTGKQLVVILDGLDEATGWTPGRSLFSTDPPNRLRVLVTARTRPGDSGVSSWINTLGWDTPLLAHSVTLPGLERRGVEEALMSMGNPLDKLATKVDVVGELHRLSEGDPLLVRLYVDALVAQGQWATTLSAEDLHLIQPGLKGYIERWWQDQREQWRVQGRNPITGQANLRLLLNAIAASLGPLTLDDLAALHPDLTDSTLLHELLEYVNRWLIGDGKRRGYSYSHPRLGYYFWEQLSYKEQVEWDRRFCEWGVTTLAMLNANQLPPNATSSYLLLHYTNHLQRSHAPNEAFFALISNGWRIAWEQLDISYSGFLNDIAQAWERAKQAYDASQPKQAEAVVQQLRAALCLSSVAALANNMPPQLVAQLVKTGLRTPAQALAMVKFMPNESGKADMLAVLAAYLPSELLSDALAAACTLRNTSDRATVLAALAPHLPPELLSEVLAAVRMLRNTSDGATVLAALAPHLPAELLGEALAAARMIWNMFDRATVLAALAPHLPPELLSEALAAAYALRNTSDRATVLAALAPHLPPELLSEALAAARTLEHTSDRATVLAALVPHLPPELLGEVLAAARMLEHTSDRATVLAALAPHLSPELLGEALAAARMLEHTSDRATVLAALAPHLPKSQRVKALGEVLAAAYALRNTSDRATVLAALAPHLPPELLSEALAAVHTLKDATVQARTLVALALHLYETDRVKTVGEALAAACMIKDPYSRVAVLGVLVRPLMISASHHLPHLYTVFADTLPVLAARSRPEFVNDLNILMPFILALAGDEAPQAAEGIYHAIQEVCAWWP